MGKFFMLLVAILLLSVGGWGMLFSTGPVDANGINTWIKIYQDSARTPLFTAFFTVGSFLLTLKTAILQRLKEAYDRDDYKELYLEHKESKPNARFYAALERLSLALATSVIFTLVTSASQMVLGFSTSTWLIAVCTGLATTAILLVAFLTIQMFLAHRDWFHKIEADMQKELKKFQQ